MPWTHQTLPEGGWARVYQPEGPGPWPVFCLLHGWTGDEHAMEPFTKWLPAGIWVLFRAPFPQDEGGYGWIPRLPRHRRSTVEDYRVAVEVLETWLPALREALPQGQWSQVHWIGFSQGAGVATLFALLHPETMHTLASIVGFVPLGAEALVREGMWRGKRVFATWGTRDPIISIARAQEMENLLRRTGASLTVCYAEVGHKLGAKCREELRRFYAGE